MNEMTKSKMTKQELEGENQRLQFTLDAVQRESAARQAQLREFKNAEDTAARHAKKQEEAREEALRKEMEAQRDHEHREKAQARVRRSLKAAEALVAESVTDPTLRVAAFQYVLMRGGFGFPD